MRKRTLQTTAASLGMIGAAGKSKAELNHYITVSLAILRESRVAPGVNGEIPAPRTVQRGPLSFTVGYDKTGAAAWLKPNSGFNGKTATVTE